MKFMRGSTTVPALLLAVNAILGVGVLSLSSQVGRLNTQLAESRKVQDELKKQNEMIPVFMRARDMERAGEWTVIRVEPTSDAFGRDSKGDKEIVRWIQVKHGEEFTYVPLSHPVMQATPGRLGGPIEPGVKLKFLAVWPVESVRNLTGVPDVYDFLRLNQWSRG